MHTRTPADPAADLSAPDLALILDVTRRLAAPFDLLTMLGEVAAATRQVLKCERCSVWLHEAARAELVLKVASDISDLRVPVGAGPVGACARDRQPINVPDCYADPRFDPQIDRRSGLRTRNSLTLPLIDHRDELVEDRFFLREFFVYREDDQCTRPKWTLGQWCLRGYSDRSTCVRGSS